MRDALQRRLRLAWADRCWRNGPHGPCRGLCRWPIRPMRRGAALARLLAMNRHDLYRDMHKALHAALFDTALRLGRLDTEDPAELRHALQQAQALLALLASHLKHENDFVHTAIEARRPGGAMRTIDEHRAQLDRIGTLN